MAGVSPKFKIEWTKKGKATYSVSGSTYEDAFKFFSKMNASKKEWATFHHETPQIGLVPDKTEPITEVTLKLGYVITMPSWSKASALGPKRKAAWDKMMTALAKHEENHRLIFLEEGAKFGEKVTAKTDLTRATLKPMFAQFSKDVKTAQDLYDSKTSHGETEGVFLPAPDKVVD
jgi:predicted secreted Zn-dependent protease